MSTRHTTVGQLTADDLGKRVEGDGWAIEQVHFIAHFNRSYDDYTSGTDLIGDGGDSFQRRAHNTPCAVSAEPLDPAYRHIDKSGIEWARIEDVWVSPDHHPLSWEDLLERHGTRGDS